MKNATEEKIAQESLKIRKILSSYIDKYNATHSNNQKSIQSVYINEKRKYPGALGCFSKNNKWYLYTVDDRFNVLLNGPFSIEGIIVALAYEMYITPADLQFNEEEYTTYLQGSSPEETFNATHGL